MNFPSSTPTWGTILTQRKTHCKTTLYQERSVFLEMIFLIQWIQFWFMSWFNRRKSLLNLTIAVASLVPFLLVGALRVADCLKLHQHVKVVLIDEGCTEVIQLKSKITFFYEVLCTVWYMKGIWVEWFRMSVYVSWDAFSRSVIIRYH